MQYIHGVARNQTLLLPDSIDDYVSDSNPVRFIEAYVDQLDLNALGFQSKNVKCKGRPAYAPSDLLKLYIYGYLNRIKSSRRLEHESHRNMEIMWLLRKLHPDFKTIADFRKDNKKAFKNVYREFSLLCHKLKLFGKELVALDGSKFKAVNSKSRNYTAKVIEKRLAEINEKINKYLKELDDCDKRENHNNGSSRKELDEKIKWLKDRKGTFDSYELSIKESAEKQVSLTDPDCRSSRKDGKFIVGYNSQIATDSKHKLIVAQEVVNDCNDRKQLTPMARDAKEALGVETLDVVVDGGYFNGKQVEECENDDITVYMNTQTPTTTKKGFYGIKHFCYDKSNDSYACPAGNTLVHNNTTEIKGRDYRYYSLSKKTCDACDLKSKCTSSKGARTISRSMYADCLDRMNQRVRDNPDIIPQRKAIVEHCFGTMKSVMDHTGFLTRGLEGVRAEMSLLSLTYNMKRVMNIIGVKKLIEAL